jgi:hypothetical protein
MRKAQEADIPSSPPISPSEGSVVSPLDTTVSPPTTIIEQSQLQLSRPSPRKKTGSVVEEINRSLPPGIELYRSYRYQMPLMRNTFDLVVLKLNLPDHMEGKLTEWRRGIEERYPSTTILIKRVEVDQNLQNNLRSKFRGSELIGPSAIPVLQEMIGTLCGNQPPPAFIEHFPRPTRENLQAVPFIAVDRPTTVDQEDLIYGEKKADGTLVLRTAFIDITDEIAPGSESDKYALRVGNTVYGRLRAIAPVGATLFGGAASFRVGEPRPAWVIECRISPFHERTEFFKVRRAMVINHANLDPSQPADIKRSPEIAKNLSALAEITNILEHRRNSRSSFIRIDGEGSAARIVSETMIHSKRLLAKFLGQHPTAPAIYRVHQKPSADTVDECVKELNELKIPAEATDFESPLSFAGILRSLEENPSPSARSLSNKLLDMFLLRTQYSPRNVGHYGLRLSEYLEIKPRDATGIANQHQLNAIFTGGRPLSETEVVRRATALNDKRWSRDERMYKLRFLEMLTERLGEVGNTFLAEAARLGNGPSYFQVDTFSKWGFVRDRQAPYLTPGDLVALKLEGFHLPTMRFEFSLTS